MKTSRNASRIFPLQHPVGMIFKRPSYTSITESPYFWWWYALTLNRAYIKCCDNSGKGELRGLYKDFGDVRHNASNELHFSNIELLRAFITWWRSPMSDADPTTRAVFLFAEPAHPFVARTITDIDEAAAVLTDRRQALIAVPLDVTKGGLIKMLTKQAALLNTRRRGSAIRKLSSSQALYIPTSTPSSDRLEGMFRCYNIYIRNKRAGERVPNSMIAYLACVSSKSNVDDVDARRSGDTLEQKRADAVKVSKYLGAAKQIIENVSEGRFP
jgi:hypothetical protein